VIVLVRWRHPSAARGDGCGWRGRARGWRGEGVRFVDARLVGGDVGAGRGAQFAAQAELLLDPDLRHPRETSGRLSAGVGVPPSKEIELVADGRSARQLSVGPPLAGVQDATVPACTVSGPPEME